MREFLEANMPAKKRAKTTIGIEDGRLAEVVQKQLGILYQSTGIVSELLRGIRLHFHKFVSDNYIAMLEKADHDKLLYW